MIRYNYWYCVIKTNGKYYLNGKQMHWWDWLLGDFCLLFLILINKEVFY